MINFPDKVDDNTTLYTVKDFSRTRLVEDYQPGDTIIQVEDTSSFAETGILTLTDQCSEVDVRAISFVYSGKTATTFFGLQLQSGFTDVAKPKRLTNVLCNVNAYHHDALKDAVISIEKFTGVKGDLAASALTGSLEARTNFVRKLVLQPRAWFSADRRLGIIPLCVEFTDLSTSNPDLWVWDFHDHTPISIISNTDALISISRSSSITNGSISKCFYNLGTYDVTLTVTNVYGTNSITIPDLINVRVEAPDLATIAFVPLATQAVLSGNVLRSLVGQTVTVNVANNGEQSEDPVTTYVWTLGDDSAHANSASARALYSVGGIYNIKLRTETGLGAYRVTKFADAIDIIERFNLWHFIFSDNNVAVTKNCYVYEFGLLSETYKAAATASTLAVTRDYGFLTGKDSYTQQVGEFRRNNGNNPRSTTSSGSQGNLLVYWGEGASSDTSNQKIRFKQFNGFNNVWSVPSLSTSTDYLTRYWNWVALNSTDATYFALGLEGPYPIAGSSPTNQDFQVVSMNTLTVSDLLFNSSDYTNGASELMTNLADNGDFSVYRSGWRDSNGYFIRNDGSGDFFRLKSFYRTEGVIGDPVTSIRKLIDLNGVTKFEGQLVNLTGGLYFFNNSGEFLLYNPTNNSWSIGGPGANSADFSQLQDKTVSNYDSAFNTLVAASDGNRQAYLFYDYSTRAQLKFNEVTFTFTNLPVRPSGEQFMASIY